MYHALAKAVKDPRDAETFRRLAAEEGRHAAVFKGMTNEVLKPKSTKAIVIPLLYRVIGKKKLYPIIARRHGTRAALRRSPAGNEGSAAGHLCDRQDPAHII